MPSVRRALIVGSILAGAAVLAAAGVGVYTLVRASLIAYLDESLIGRARLLTSAVEQKQGQVKHEFGEFSMAEFQHARGPGYLQLWRPDGSVLYRSPSLGAGSLAPEARDHGRGWESLASPSGTVRVVAFHFRPRRDEEPMDRSVPLALGAGSSDGESVRLVLAWDTSELQATLASLRAILLVVGAVALAALCGVLWWLIRRALRPVGVIAGEIEHLGEDALSARIRTDGVPGELAPIVHRLNDLLGRLDAAFERERSFRADVAHELRTPMAALRSALEVCLSRPRGADDYEETVRDCRQVVIEIQVMVENLLTLSRLEAGQMDTAPQPVPLSELVVHLWAPLAPRANARGVQVRLPLPDGIVAHADPGLAELVLRNLLDNAVAYVDDGGSIDVEVLRDGISACVCVANSGSNLAPEHVAAGSIFDRFWQHDASRSQAGVHCGLGLSLVQRAMAAMGGSVAAEVPREGHFWIVARFPSADATDAPCQAAVPGPPAAPRGPADA